MWALEEHWDRVNSRLIGRVEWRLEQVMFLQRCFPRGERLCSVVFSAANINGLQFVFYPCGSMDARDNYCSLFVHCPERAELKCWLSVGKQRREAYRSHPNSIGRSNFCLTEGCIDRATDTLTLALEIA